MRKYYRLINYNINESLTRLWFLSSGDTKDWNRGARGHDGNMRYEGPVWYYGDMWWWYYYSYMLSAVLVSIVINGALRILGRMASVSGLCFSGLAATMGAGLGDSSTVFYLLLIDRAMVLGRMRSVSVGRHLWIVSRLCLILN